MDEKFTDDLYPEDNPYTYGYDDSEEADQSDGNDGDYYSGSYGNGGNYSQTGNYGNYGNYTYRGEEEHTGYGLASLILGVLSLFLFASCINVVLAVLAIIFGAIQISRYRRRGIAIAGIVTGSISIVLFIGFWGMFLTGGFLF